MENLITDSPIFQPVRKVLTSEILPGMGTNPDTEYAILTGEEGSEKILRLVSEDYELVPNQDIIENLAEAFGQELKMVHYQSYRDAQFSMHLSLGEVKDKKEVQVGDAIGTTIRLQNSYNGRAQFSYTMGIERLVCSNGMTRFDEGARKKSKRHTASIAEFNNPKAFAESYFEMEDYLGLMVENINEFRNNAASLPGDMGEADEEFLNEIASGTGFPKRQLEDVFDRIYLEAEENNWDTDGWLVYNGFNYIMNHNDEIKIPPHKREAIDLKIRAKLLEV